MAVFAALVVKKQVFPAFIQSVLRGVRAYAHAITEGGGKGTLVQFASFFQFLLFNLEELLPTSPIGILLLTQSFLFFDDFLLICRFLLQSEFLMVAPIFDHFLSGAFGYEKFCHAQVPLRLLLFLRLFMIIFVIITLLCSFSYLILLVSELGLLRLETGLSLRVRIIDDCQGQV